MRTVTGSDMRVCMQVYDHFWQLLCAAHSLPQHVARGSGVLIENTIAVALALCGVIDCHVYCVWSTRDHTRA